MTGGWPAAIVLAASLCWLGWLTAPAGLVALVLVFGWMWRRS